MPTSAQPKTLPITYVAQEKENWCWAACFQMIRQLFGLEDLDQCALAKRLFIGDKCDDPGLDRSALPGEAARECGLRCTQTPEPADPKMKQLGMSDITNEIDANRPVELQIADANGGHVVLVVGYGPGDILQIFDPDGAIKHTTVSFAELSSTGYKGKSWETSFYRFAARPEPALNA